MNKKARFGWAKSLGVVTACLIFYALAPLHASEPYLAPGHPDGIALLAPPPMPGSAEAAADLELSRSVIKKRTPEEEARAKKSEGLSFSLFVSAIGPEFDLSKLPKTDALLKKVRAEIGGIIDTPKFHWKRKRPYEMDPELKWGKPEDSPSYPSGHSTRGTVYSLLLADLFPEKREAILEKGREIGWDRVLIGKHFLTDIRAGRVLGQAIVHELKDSKAFEEDLAAAKAEIMAMEGELQKAGK